MPYLKPKGRRKKIVADMSVKGGCEAGGVDPPVRNLRKKYCVFFLEKNECSETKIYVLC